MRSLIIINVLKNFDENKNKTYIWFALITLSKTALSLFVVSLLLFILVFIYNQIYFSIVGKFFPILSSENAVFAKLFSDVLSFVTIDLAEFSQFTYIMLAMPIAPLVVYYSYSLTATFMRKTIILIAAAASHAGSLITEKIDGKDGTELRLPPERKAIIIIGLLSYFVLLLFYYLAKLLFH